MNHGGLCREVGHEFNRCDMSDVSEFKGLVECFFDFCYLHTISMTGSVRILSVYHRICFASNHKIEIK